jgi:hypothetical protein
MLGSTDVPVRLNDHLHAAEITQYALGVCLAVSQRSEAGSRSSLSILSPSAIIDSQISLPNPDAKMDPVSALSLVANIFAVVSFSKDVVNVACQIRDSGDSDQLNNLGAAAVNLMSAIGRMNLKPDSPGSDQNAAAGRCRHLRNCP